MCGLCTGKTTKVLEYWINKFQSAINIFTDPYNVVEIIHAGYIFLSAQKNNFTDTFFSKHKEKRWLWVRMDDTLSALPHCYSLGWWCPRPGMYSWMVCFLCFLLSVESHQTISACLLCPSIRQLSIPLQMGEPEAWGSEERKATGRAVSSHLLWGSLTLNRPGFFVHHNLPSIMKLVNAGFLLLFVFFFLLSFFLFFFLERGEKKVR